MGTDRRAGTGARRASRAVRDIAPAASGDLVLRLTGLSRSTPACHDARRGGNAAPLGVLGNREAFHGNWAALGHILVVGLPGGGGGTISLALSPRWPPPCRPTASGSGLSLAPAPCPPELGALPHLAGGPIRSRRRPPDRPTLAELREELFRRMRDEAGTTQDRAEIVLAVDELVDLRGVGDDDTTSSRSLAREGPLRGIRLLAATARPEALDDALLAHFPTRLVLRLIDEEQSLRLLGLTDATELGEGGWLILRLAGRRPWQPDGWSPLTLRGVRVPPDGLAALVQQLLAAWGGPAPEQPAAGKPPR